MEYIVGWWLVAMAAFVCRDRIAGGLGTTDTSDTSALQWTGARCAGTLGKLAADWMIYVLAMALLDTAGYLM